MPTILRIGKARVVIYPNDHRPAHVHVIGTTWEAIFTLHCPSGPPELREAYNASPATLQQVSTQLMMNLGDLCSRWRDVHGLY